MARAVAFRVLAFCRASPAGFLLGLSAAFACGGCFSGPSGPCDPLDPPAPVRQPDVETGVSPTGHGVCGRISA